MLPAKRRVVNAPERVAVAERAARAGAVTAADSFRTDLEVETKRDKTDPVTEVDRRAQERVVSEIRRVYPDDTVVGEETGTVSTLPAHGVAWVVDPIDGTTNFVRGLRFWGTSVAAVVDGDPVGAATSLPAEGDLYAAGPDQTTRNGSPVSVSDRTDPGTFVVGLTGWWPARAGDRQASLFRASAERFGDVRRLGSMQGTLALVADGGLEAAVMLSRPHPWDAIAGVHLVRQAGGTATDLHGDRWEHDSEGLVVSNGTAHDAVLAAVRGSTDAGTGG